MPYDREIDVAIDAAQNTSRLVLEHYARFEAIPDAGVEISTTADFAAQDLIVGQIRAAFPEDGIQAEEDRPYMREVPRRTDRFWVIDPIDGSRGFARKTGEFSVMIGLVVDGDPVLGVVAEPCAERLMWAIQGEGCYLRTGDGTERRVHVSTTRETMDAVFVMSRGSHISDETYQTMYGFGGMRRSYSSGVKLAAVARGEADAYVSGYHKYADYDMCAGHMLVLEAGGRLTDFTGAGIRYPKPGTFLSRGVVASNGHLHHHILEATRKKQW